MRVRFKPDMLILSVESDADRESFATWRAGAAGHVFSFEGGSKGGALRDLGPRDSVCRTPINVVFDQCDPRWRPISNLAATPFTLHGRTYASVEGFWQSLRFDDAEDRRRVAALSGYEAKAAASSAPKRPMFVYNGESCPVGGFHHHQLMRQACKAKFIQDVAAREALMSTGDRRPASDAPRPARQRDDPRRPAGGHLDAPSWSLT